ncbi:jg1457 [Pararge aegeria aegeria]|uniref:Jg1457 protein n=1 Tax=Pararge aegeria aegeria TaxID=348720 RepID=A0A8S4QHJ7_9NEOP|nr:jg1457 [Pararge aegeria aegeria]
MDGKWKTIVHKRIRKRSNTSQARGQMEAGRAFQILAVRIRNEVAKRFVRVRGFQPRRDADPYGASRFDGKKGETRSNTS